MQTLAPATRQSPARLIACVIAALPIACSWLSPDPEELKLTEPRAIVLDPNKPFHVCFSANLASGGAGNLTFVWNYADGTNCDAACQAQPPLPPGSCEVGSLPPPDKLHHYPERPKAFYSPVLTVMDGDLQEQTVSFGSVLVGNKRPRAAFKDPSPIGFVGIPYNIDGSASRDDDGSIAAWRYDWGDKTQPDVKHDASPAMHSYQAGTYSVSLTVLDDNDTPSEPTPPWQVRIVNDTTRPSVWISYPSDGQQVADGTTIVATARDDVLVTRVMFSDERGEFASVPGPGPVFSTTWNTARVGNGERRLTAVAFDEAGNSSLPFPVTVIVQNR